MTEQALWGFAQITTYCLFGVMFAALVVGILSIREPQKWGEW